MIDTNLSELVGTNVPRISLSATNGQTITLADIKGTTVVYAYPRTSPPDSPPIEGWHLIPGARGCTPQSCAFRDHFSELRDAGADAVFGLSTQSTTFQQEVVSRLHLPFPLLSDATLAFAIAMGLPTFDAGGMTLLRRLTMILREGAVADVIYPVDDPASNAGDVIDRLVLPIG
jgi:peroxiredoxin (alkyl hydroperoxide reductase subunit C)